MHLQESNFNYIPPPPLPIEDSSLNKKMVNDRLDLYQSQLGSSNFGESFFQAKGYAEKEDWQRAVEAYEHLVGLLPQDNRILGKIYSLIAFCSSKLGEREKALRYFKKAVKLCPDIYEIYMGLGMEYLLLKKRAKAIQAFREAIRFNKRGSGAHFFLGYLYSMQRQWELAIKHYKEAIRLEEKNESYYVYLASLYFRLGQENAVKRERLFLEGIKVSKKLLEITERIPSHSGIYNNIGVIFSLLGRSEEALEMYQKAIELDPSSEVAQKNLFALKNALVKERLLKKGSLKRVPEPITDFTPYRNRKLFQIKGKPLSQTIIEERR